MSRSSSHSTDSKRYYDWIYHAYQDMLAAKLLMSDNRLYGPAVFHCQQAMEKVIKGYLLYKTRKLFDGHNVTWLCKQAALLDESFRQWIGKTTLLNRLYIETRYPADIPLEIDGETMESLLRMSGEMMDFICDLTKFNFNSYHKKSRR